MIFRPHRPVACPGCNVVGRMVVIAQQVSIDPRRLSVRVEHVILACVCKRAWDVTRAGFAPYQMPAAPEPPPSPGNGLPPDDAEPQEIDSDLPARFRGRM